VVVRTHKFTQGLLVLIGALGYGLGTLWLYFELNNQHMALGSIGYVLGAFALVTYIVTFYDIMVSYTFWKKRNLEHYLVFSRWWAISLFIIPSVFTLFATLPVWTYRDRHYIDEFA
jgi:hypothetical protein